MVSTTDQDARLKYLEHASTLLQASSPTASAFLQTKRRTVADEIGRMRTSDEKSQACNSCGTLVVLGWSCSMERSTPRAKHRQARERPIQTKALTLRCNNCNATIISSSRKPPKVNRGKLPDILQEAPTPIMDSRKATAPSTPQSGVQAASRKARNKKSSLQSMLASHTNTTNAPTRPGLNLMDFMKG